MSPWRDRASGRFVSRAEVERMKRAPGAVRTVYDGETGAVYEQQLSEKEDSR